MNRRPGFLAILVLISTFVLSACVGLIPLEEEPVSGEFGPNTSPQERHAETFEALWKNFEENYIYFETANVNWDALHNRYLERANTALTAEEFAALIQELEAELPAGSLLYESRSERIERETADNSAVEGIGAYVGFGEEPKPHIILLDVIEGSAAEKAGLKPHDSIFEIDGRPILLEEGLNAVDRVRGPAGSSVTLTIQSPGKPERSVEVKRGRFNRTGKLTSRIMEGTEYGYLLFPPIGYDTLAEDVLQQLQTLTTNRKLEGLVLDLRIANARAGWPLEALSTIFYDGTLGEFYDRNNKQSLEVEGQDVFSSQEVPLVILVGQNTTGLPEILAAGLQTHKRATIIGETTPGQIETSSAFYLPDGSQVFIETISFVLPNGDDLGNTGVVPTVSVDAGWDEILPDQDPVLDRAIEYLDEQK